MTREELMQYRKLGAEIKLLQEQVEGQEDELRRSRKFDAVRGSSPVCPYAVHSIAISGSTDPALHTEYRETIAALKRTIRERQQEMCRLERYISGIEDSELRRIFILRYMGASASWVQVAHKMGAGYSADAVRAQHNRYLGLKF